MEKKRAPKDMTSIHKKFEEKKQEEISKVEARFTALLNDSDNKAPNNAQIPSN